MHRVNKKYFPAFLVCALCLLSACGGSKNNTVSTLFIHKYGTALSENDWDSRGGNGQIVTMCKDGVTITENYVDHLLEGKTTYSFPHSSVVDKEKVFRQGHLLSETLHFTTGIPKEKTEFISNKERHLTTWFDNGNPKSIEKFINSALQEGEYYNTSNEIESRVENGAGTKIVRNTYGEFISKIEFNNGQKTLMTTYYSNNDPKVVTPYQNDQVHGIKKYFAINGVPERFEEWKNGIQQGTTLVFRDGQEHSEQQFAAGSKNGLETIFNDHGMVACEITWKNGLKHGVQKTYINDTVRLEWYYKDKKVSHSDFEKLAVR